MVAAAVAGFDDLVDFFDSMQTRSPVRELHRALFGLAEVRPSLLVADLGGGPGLLARMSADEGARAVELDRSRGMLLRAVARAGESRVSLSPVRGEIASLPFRDVSLDRIFCTNVLFLQQDAVSLLREAARVLRPGGKLLSLDPTRRMNTVTMRERARRMGWDGVAQTSVVSWGRAAEFNHPYSKERLARELRAAGLVTEIVVEEWDGMALLARAKKPPGE